MDFQETYNRGRVPAAPIWEIVDRYIAEHDTTMSALSLALGYAKDSLSRFRFRSENEVTPKGSIAFTQADMLVTRCGGPFQWREPALEPHYLSVVLEKSCAWCEEPFEITGEEHTSPIYCSRDCYNKAANKRRYAELPVCSNGHKRSAKNTKRDNRGDLICKVCARASSQRYRDKKRAELDKACAEGHPRTPENTFHDRAGKRWCRICASEKGKRSVEARYAA